MEEVCCHRCGRRGLGEMPQRPPAGWIIAFANAVFGRGGALGGAVFSVQGE